MNLSKEVKLLRKRALLLDYLYDVFESLSYENREEFQSVIFKMSCTAFSDLVAMLLAYKASMTSLEWKVFEQKATKPKIFDKNILSAKIKMALGYARSTERALNELCRLINLVESFVDSESKTEPKAVIKSILKEHLILIIAYAKIIGNNDARIKLLAQKRLLPDYIIAFMP